MQHIVFRPLLVIEDELQGDAGLARPVRMGWRAAIADQVAWIMFVIVHAEARL